MVDKLSLNIQEWLINYLRNRDIFVKSIIEIKPEGNHVQVFFKQAQKDYFISPNLEEFNDNSIDEAKFTIIVTLNTKNNFSFLQKNWKQYIPLKKLQIMFVNPLSRTEYRWVISPYTHSLISDAKSLKQGLFTIFETVEEVTSSQIEKMNKVI